MALPFVFNLMSCGCMTVCNILALHRAVFRDSPSRMLRQPLFFNLRQRLLIFKAQTSRVYDSYLLENWKRFLAPFCPYFLRSFILGSLVRSPAFFKDGRIAGSTMMSILEIP